MPADELAPPAPIPSGVVEVRRAAVAGIGWSATARLGQQAVQFVIAVLLARLLSPSDFGLLGMAGIFTGVVTAFSDFGLPAALIQRDAPEERHISSVFWFNLVLGVLFTGALILLAPQIAKLYAEPLLVPITILLAVTPTIWATMSVQQALLTKSMRFRDLGLIQFAGMGVAGCGALLMAWSGYGVWSLVVQALLLPLVSTLMVWTMVRWRPHLIFESAAIKELMRFGANLLAFSATNYVNRNGDNFLVGKFLGAGSLGLYVKAYSMMLLPINQVSGLVGNVMFPVLAHIQHDGPRIKRVYLRTIAAIALIAFPAIAGLFVVSEHAIFVLLGPKWLPMVGTLRILCWVSLLQSIWKTAGWMFLATGRTDLLFRWHLLVTLAFLVSFAIGVWMGSIESVAWCYAGAATLLLYWNFTVPGRLVGLRFGEVLRAVQGPLMAAAGMALAVWLVDMALANLLSSLLLLGVDILVGALTYGFVAVRLPVFEDVRAVVTEQVRRRRARPVAETLEGIG